MQPKLDQVFKVVAEAVRRALGQEFMQRIRRLVETDQPGLRAGKLVHAGPVLDQPSGKERVMWVQ
jgi:hypothetical protein